jgi:hypothetical protein
MKLKKILCVVLLALALSFTAFGVSCAKGPSITLDKTTLTLVEETVEVLTVTTENYDGEIVWTSSNEQIVTVKDGVVSGINEGSATVTASAGNVSATCSVTVTGTGHVPLLTTGGYDSLSIYCGDNVSVPVSLLYKGKIVVAESVSVTTDNQAIAIAEIEDGRVNVTATGVGTTTVKVSATYLGKTAEKFITVVAKENVSVSLGATELTVENGEYFLDISRSQKVNGTFQATSVDLLFSLSDNGQDMSESNQVSWTVSDSSVISLSNGEVTALKVGESDILVEYTTKAGTEIELAIEVSVTETVEKLGADTGDYKLYELKDIVGDPVITNAKLFTSGEILSAKIGDVELLKGQNSSTSALTLSRTALDNDAELGRQTLKVKTDLVTYELETAFCDMLIETKAEVTSALSLGAFAVSTGKEELWDI